MNIATTYLGLKLRNPLVVGASPFCDDVHQALRLQDAGAGALVMRSLFAEQIEPRPASPASRPRPGSDPAVAYPEFADYQLSPADYLDHVRHLKKVLTIPLIASLNAANGGEWVEFARQLEGAGADAIELNFYRIVTDVSRSADDIEGDLLRVVGRLAKTVKLPIAVKLSPFHTSLARIAHAIETEGAAGLLLFNRFYQPDIDIEEVEVRPNLRLSEPGELLLRLRWLAILSPQLRGSLAAAGGIQGAAGVVKSLLAGAHAAQLVSVLIKQGPHMLSVILRDLEVWMTRHGCADLAVFRGRLNLASCAVPSAYERANYIRIIGSGKDS